MSTKAGALAVALAMIGPHAARSEPNTAAGESVLRIISYNVQFLPDPVSWKNERPDPEYRANRIADELSGFDVAGLQEVFHPKHRQQFIDRTRAGWNGKLHKVMSPQPEGFFTNGGCMIVSRRPFATSSCMVFTHYSSPADYGQRADGYAAKGVLHARIVRSEAEAQNCIDAFATHLEARADDLRPLQYKELAKFIKEKSDAAYPIVLLGDLNTYGMLEYQKDSASQYSQLMRELNAIRPDGSVIDLWPHLRGEAHGGTTDQESADIGKRVDYIMISNPRRSKVQLKPLRIDVELFQDERVGALSDHNAVIAELEWPALVDQRDSQ
jgi:endonuclease/exonuclease/phosphatase family metal-dependent hydrolase